MTASGQLACVCGAAIKPCPIALGRDSTLCHGYVHLTTLQHIHPNGQEGLAEPREAA